MTLEISIVNAETGEQIIREMNADELAQHQKDLAQAAEKAANEAALEAAKESAQSKLVALGLTSDDLKALGLQVEHLSNETTTI